MRRGSLCNCESEEPEHSCSSQTSNIRTVPAGSSSDLRLSPARLCRRSAVHEQACTPEVRSREGQFRCTLRARVIPLQPARQPRTRYHPHSHGRQEWGYVLHSAAYYPREMRRASFAKCSARCHAFYLPHNGADARLLPFELSEKSADNWKTHNFWEGIGDP